MSGATADPLGQSQYPAEAVEITVTFLIPVTDENRHEVDGPLDDALQVALAPLDVQWWTDKSAHFLDHQQRMVLHFKRPPMWTRPRKRKTS